MKKNVQVQFSISKIISNNSNESPLTFDSIMNFEFEDTNDFCFIMKLCNIAKQFIQFLCYRRNIVLQEVALYTLNEDKKYHKFASIYLLNEIDNPEIDTLNRKQYISQKYIEGFEGKILEDIANNSLYLEHLPETYKSGRTINASRFIMITAAFEWEFNRICPEGVQKDAETLKIEREIDKVIKNLIDQSTGKRKRIYIFLGSYSIMGK